MKKTLVTIFILISVFLSGLFLIGKFLAPCNRPLKYSLGSIDPRYGISQDEFLRVMVLAESVWEDEAKRNVFEYDPNSDFKINLIFDERKQSALEAESAAEEIKAMEDSHEELIDEYEKMIAQKESLENKYKKESSQYEREFTEFNDEVQKWNEQGGAPEDEYKKLKKKEKELTDWKNVLSKQLDEINSLIAKINTLVSKEKTLVDNQNQKVMTFKEKYEQEREFDQGDYDKGRINVYYYEDIHDLRLVLAHELGHYLGIDHVDGSSSVMYYLMRDQDMQDLKISPQDLEALNGACSPVKI